MLAKDLKKGDTVYAPWRIAGDDKNLTGTVVSMSKGHARILWGSNGDCTQEGDESVFAPNTEIDLASVC